MERQTGQAQWQHRNLRCAKAADQANDSQNDTENGAQREQNICNKSGALHYQQTATANDEQLEAQAALLDLMSVEREARLVAMRLKQLREEKHSIYDPEREEFRPAEWRDMVVLMRSPAGKAEAFAKEFNRAGIPLSAARSGFFQSIEITDLLSLLKLIDNPLQDVPLLAVLRSPLAGFSLDELAEIRAHNREKPLWAALRKYQRELGSPKSNVQCPKSGVMGEA